MSDLTHVDNMAAALKAFDEGTPVEIGECDIPKSGMLVRALSSGVVDRV